MIPTWFEALAAFGCAAAFFTVVGLGLARAVMPSPVPALGVAPSLGWAVFSAAALPVVAVTGLNRVAIGGLAALFLAASAYFGWRTKPAPALPRWTVALAAAAAWLPATAIMPKQSAAGILLAPPMFDHVKIAVVQAILRDGLPVPNPFYGPGGRGILAYYYLWHVGTAEVARLLGISAWAAEAGMTAFTAFSSLMLVMGIAQAFGGRAPAILASVGLLLPGSLRPLLADALGWDLARGVVPGVSDIGGWLNQAAWVPQHMAGACSVMVSGLLLIRLAALAETPVALALALTVAAGFATSVWVGGVTFAVAGVALGIYLVYRIDAGARRRFLARTTGAAILTILLVAPLAMTELQAVQVRHVSGMRIEPYHVLGWLVPPSFRLWVDPLAFPPLLLFLFPALLPSGLYGLQMLKRVELAALFVLGAACLLVAAMLRSTIDNDDLGWRAVLPALLLLAASAGCGLVVLFRTRRRQAILCLALGAMGIPDAWRMLHEYAVGFQPGDPAGFASSQAVWEAVRRHAGPSDRIANNPLYLASATPWPVNISWATLSDRPSCYASRDSVIAYGLLTPAALDETEARFRRVFDGKAQPGDVTALARADDCAIAVILPSDGAWLRDPFSGSAEYAPAEKTSGWRVYQRVFGK